MLWGCFGMIWAIWGQCGGDLRYGRGALGHNRGTLGGKTDVSLVVSFYTDPNSAGTSSPSRSGAPGLLRSPTTDLSWTALASRNCRAPRAQIWPGESSTLDRCAADTNSDRTACPARQSRLALWAVLSSLQCRAPVVVLQDLLEYLQLFLRF